MNRQRTFDLLGLLTGTGVRAVATAGTPWDTGGGYTEAMLVIDITAISASGTNDRHQLRFQVSTTSTFTAYHTKFLIPMGSMHANGTADTTGVFPESQTAYSNLATWPGPTLLPLRIIQPVNNDHAGTVYRWVRFQNAISATTATGVNLYATLCQLH